MGGTGPPRRVSSARGNFEPFQAVKPGSFGSLPCRVGFIGTVVSIPQGLRMDFDSGPEGFHYPFIGFRFRSLELSDLFDFKRKIGGRERLCRLLAIFPFT